MNLNIIKIRISPIQLSRKCACGTPESRVCNPKVSEKHGLKTTSLQRRVISKKTLYFVIYDMIYLFTAIGLSPSDISIVHIYTQTLHRTIQNKQYIEQHNSLIRKNADRAPSLRCIH